MLDHCYIKWHCSLYPSLLEKINFPLSLVIAWRNQYLLIEKVHIPCSLLIFSSNSPYLFKKIATKCFETYMRTQTSFSTHFPCTQNYYIWNIKSHSLGEKMNFYFWKERFEISILILIASEIFISLNFDPSIINIFRSKYVTFIKLTIK